MPASPWHRVCRACKQELPLSRFKVRGGTLDNLDVWCGTCRGKKHKTALRSDIRKRRLLKGVITETAVNNILATVKKHGVKRAEKARIAKVSDVWTRASRSADLARRLLKSLPIPPQHEAWRRDMEGIIKSSQERIKENKSRGVSADPPPLFWYDVAKDIRRAAQYHLANYPEGAEKLPFIIF
jgi:hypothetical protein